jgi:putative ABC transport system ATP-binding protein
VVSNVRKLYEGDVQALDVVSLHVEPGEFVALQGPSGCGKSTLLNLVGCIDLPTEGEVLVEGRSTTSLTDDELTLLRRDRIGTIFQFFNFLPTISLEENVALPLVLQGVPKQRIAPRVADVLAAVGVTQRAKALPAHVSGGELQRAAIARAIVHRPAIVLADEPTGNLDTRSGEIVLTMLRGFADEGQAILMATHSDQAAAYADRRILMRDGRIEAVR